MSILLPVVKPQPDFIGHLLHEQQALSAVERFSLIDHEPQQRRNIDESVWQRSNDSFNEESTNDQPAQARYYRDLLPASPPGPGQQYAFEVDLDKCSGCKACVVACHTLNGLEEGEAWRRVGAVVPLGHGGHVQHVTTGCHHCEDPACLRGCPVKAYEKDASTGIVRHLDDQCIGCKYCTMMCPYEVPTYNDRLGIVRKCDMCQQRLATGEAPACVQACPNGAIAITVVEARRDAVHTNADDVATTRLAPGAPSSALTYPTTRYKTASASSFQSATPQDANLDSVADAHWPLAAMLVATQISIGVVLVERLAALQILWGDQSVPDAFARTATALALLVGGLGLGLAPLHLGQPLRAWRVFLGFRTSWLSREAVLLGQFIGLLGVATVLRWLPALEPYLPDVWAVTVPQATTEGLLTLALVTGLAGLYSSAQIYIATGRNWWRAERTLLRFGGSAAVGGLAWVVPVCLVTSHIGFARMASTTVAVLLALKLLWEYCHLSGFRPNFDELDLRSRRLIAGPLRSLAAARFATGVSSVALAAMVAAFVSPEPQGPWLLIASMGMAMLLTSGELCERLLYFSAVVYARMPGTLR